MTVALECEELLQRTRLQCDEATEFQRVVSLYVAARHGTWTYSQYDGAWTVHCTVCGAATVSGGGARDGRRGCDACHTGLNGLPCARGLQRRMMAASHASSGFADGRGSPLVTPVCAGWERTTTDGCVFTEEAVTLIERRAAFLSDEGKLMLRIKRASHGIRGDIS